MTEHPHDIDSTDPAVSRQTWVSLGTAILLVASLIGATVWITDRLADLGGEIAELDLKIEQQNHRLESRLSDLEAESAKRFTLAQAAENALRTAVANPGMRVPDPRNPGQFFEVDTQNQQPGDA